MNNYYLFIIEINFLFLTFKRAHKEFSQSFIIYAIFTSYSFELRSHVIKKHSLFKLRIISSEN